MNTFRKVLLLILPLFFFVTILSGCAVIPVSDEELDAVGADVYRNMIDQYGVYCDSKLDSYVESIGKRVEATSDYNGKLITFTVLDTPMVNAFSVPGGYVFVTRGLLARANSECEVAYVMGHEIGHLTARHAAQRISQLRTSGFFSSIVGYYVAGQTKDTQLANLAASIIDFSSALVILNYGRDAEFEADRLGLRYGLAAGYNPRDGAKFLKTLETMEESKGERDALSMLLATHPPTNDRVRAARDENKELVSAESASIKNLEVNRDGYLKWINGMVLGESLETGIVTGEVYYNKPYKFFLKTPQGWNITVARSYHAGIYQKSGNNLMWYMLAYAQTAEANTALDVYATGFLKKILGDDKYKPTFYSYKFLGLTALRSEYSNSAGVGTKTCFFKKDNLYFVLLFRHGGGLDDFNKKFMDAMSNFGFMTREQADKISEDELRLYTSQNKDTFASVCLGYYGDDKYRPRLMEYNGFFDQASAVGGKGSSATGDAGEVAIKTGTILKVPPANYLEN